MKDDEKNRAQLIAELSELRQQMASASPMPPPEEEPPVSTEAALGQTRQRLQTVLTQLQETQQQLVQLERLHALGIMASSITHDLLNLLGVIQGFSELLLVSPEALADTQTVTENVQMIHTAAEDATQIVHRLREFYRHRQENEIFQAVELNSLVTETIALTQPRWKQRSRDSGGQINVLPELSGEVSSVAGNPTELREVLTNLIFNATDAMPLGGTLTIRTRPDGEQALIEVSDTGIGMSAAERERCIEPFFTTKGERGTGLGLAVVHGIVQRHQGRLGIQSSKGHGTTVRIWLPVWNAQKTADDEAETALLAQKRHLLVIESDPRMRRVVTAYLSQKGDTFETAADGREGLQKFYAGRFDLVIVERAMPQINGAILASVIKRVAPNKPIVMLTDLDDALPAGVDALLRKPIRLAPFWDAIKKALSP